MLIGKDFEKIEVNIAGLHGVEPNAFLGDTVLFIVSLVLALYTFRLKERSDFNRNWTYFFIVFGFSFLAGGLGHFFFLYWGVTGKYAGWLLSVCAMYFLERAMISIHPRSSKIRLLNQIAWIKLVLALLISSMVFVWTDLDIDPQRGLLVPSINSAIGLVVCLGVLTEHYSRVGAIRFNYFQLSLLIMIPSAAVQAMKISIFPWLDRNDISHVLLFVSLILYWKGIKSFNEQRSIARTIH